jgi:carbon-monoxide dehydrogenase small subunit
LKVEQDFVVTSPIDEVWELFENVPEVVNCLPGARLLEVMGEDTYRGEVAVKIGPISARFEGEARHVSDASTNRGSIEGDGADKKGGSRGRVKINYSLSKTEAGTKVSVDSDITLSGRAAQFGRPGLVKEMTSRILLEFGNNLQKSLVPLDEFQAKSTEAPNSADSAGEISGLSLFFGSLWGAFSRWFSSLLGRSGGS